MLLTNVRKEHVVHGIKLVFVVAIEDGVVIAKIVVPKSCNNLQLTDTSFLILLVSSATFIILSSSQRAMDRSIIFLKCLSSKFVFAVTCLFISPSELNFWLPKMTSKSARVSHTGQTVSPLRSASLTFWFLSCTAFTPKRFFWQNNV